MRSADVSTATTPEGHPYVHVERAIEGTLGPDALRTGAPITVLALGREAAQTFADDRRGGQGQGGCEGALARLLGGSVVNTGGDVHADGVEIELKTAPPRSHAVPCVFGRDGSMTHHAVDEEGRFAALRGLFAMIANHLPLLAPQAQRLPDIRLRSGTEIGNAALRRLCVAYDRANVCVVSHRGRAVQAALNATTAPERLLARAAADIIRSKNRSMLRGDAEDALCGFVELHPDIAPAYAMPGPAGVREYGRVLFVRSAGHAEPLIVRGSVRYTNSVLKFSVRTGARVMTHRRGGVAERVTRALVYMNRRLNIRRAILEPSSDQLHHVSEPEDLLAHASAFLGRRLRTRGGRRRVAVQMLDVPARMAKGLSFDDVLTGRRERWVEGILDIDHPMLQADLDDSRTYADTPDGMRSTFTAEYLGTLSERDDR